MSLGIKDDELAEIRNRDAIRKTKTSTVSEEAAALAEILKPIIYQHGVNNGSIYADWLAEELLKTGKIKLVST